MNAELLRIVSDTNDSVQNWSRTNDPKSFQQILLESQVSEKFDSILTQTGYDISRKLDLQDRQSMQLFLSVVFTRENIAELGFHNLIKQIRHKINSENGQIQHCEIQLDRVNYVASVKANSRKIPTVLAPVSLPSFMQSETSTTANANIRYMLRNISAIFKPATMTLILGPPGCGKSSLLRLLAGHLKSGTMKNRESLTGRVTFNGLEENQVNMARMAAYIPQDDNHIPTLTVEETLNFSHQCFLGQLDPHSALYVNEKHKVEILMNTLGLEECAQTIVGNDLIRGVSGGQKKRVTVGEMLTSNAPVILMDEFSTGLDTSTTYDITKSLRIMTDLLEKTCVFAMLQPPPEVYNLFDNILVLDQGEMIYHGPRQELPDYFQSIGYTCPDRKDIADFLQEVTTQVGDKYRNHKEEYTCPRTTSEFARRFEQTILFHKTVEDIQKSVDFSTSMLEERPEANETVAHSILQSIRVVASRQWKMSKRDKKYNKVRLIQSTFLGFLIGFVFYNLPSDSDPRTTFTKLSLMFLFLLFQALATFSTIQKSVEGRYIFYRQSLYHFFPEISLVLAETAIEFMWMTLQTTCFALPLYWLPGLSNTAAQHFIIFWIFAVFIGIIYFQLYKLWALVGMDTPIAKVLCGFSLMFSMVFSGYMIQEHHIPNGWIWLYWINPMAWAYKGMAQNEFLSDRYTEQVGEQILHSFGISTDSKLIGISLLVLLCTYLILVLLTTIAYRYIRHNSTSYSSVNQKTNCNEPEEANLETLYPGMTEEGYVLHQDHVNVDIKGSSTNSIAFTPVTLSLSSVNYSVLLQNKEKKQLLHNVHGLFQPGTMTALMGSSGAGKTTLLDVIAGRKSAGIIDGDMYVNSHPLDRNSFNSISGYVEQNDIHINTCTVRESFEFSANLRLPADVSNKMKQDFVKEILQVLDLTEQQDTLVSQLSLSSRKRLTIGVELVSNPSILFLDEPTSGLDAYAATIVIECVKRIAESGRTVICTIHQPSTSLFENFDQLLLLKTGGEMIYFGHLGEESHKLISYFETIPNIPKICKNSNPATYVLDVIGAGTSSQLGDQPDFAQLYRESSLCQSNLKIVEEWSNPKDNVTKLLCSKSYEATGMMQFQLLIRRTSLKYWRSPSFNVSRLVIAVLIALIFGSVYSSGELATDVQVISRINAIFNALVNVSIICMMTGLAITFSDRAVFYRERQSRMYTTWAYSLSIAIIEIMYTAVFATLFFLCIYWLLGLSSSLNAIAWFWLITFLCMCFFMYFGFFVVFVAPDFPTSLVICSGFASLIMVFAGFFITSTEMAKGWHALYYFLPLHYVLEALVTTQFFSDNSLIQIGQSKLQMPVSTFVEQIFFKNSFSYDNRYYDLMVLLTWIICLQVGSFLCLKFLNHVKR